MNVPKGPRQKPRAQGNPGSGRAAREGGRAAREKSGAPREKLERIYGLSAALAAFAHRPEDIVSIAHTQDVRRALAEVLRAAARRRIAYREVDDETLSELAQSVHHEGVCLLARPPAPLDDAGLSALADDDGLLLALDGVENPHNVGAILRSAAYFGVRALVLVDASGSKVTAASRRVAEGGAEAVQVARVTDLAVALRTLRDEGFSVFGADARATVQLTGVRWPARSVLVLGHEQHGLTPAVRKACTTLVSIAGTGAVESLNVSVAAGIFMASFANARAGAAANGGTR
jgi:TrmH RNA methyltransferase